MTIDNTFIDALSLAELSCIGSDARDKALGLIEDRIVEHWPEWSDEQKAKATEVAMMGGGIEDWC